MYQHISITINSDLVSVINIVMVLFSLSIQNLTMFGIDIIVEKGTGHHVVIDINYFPGKSVAFVSGL